MVNFIQDLQEVTIKQLTAYGVKYKAKDNLHDLLIKLYTFWNRYISPEKRSVRISEELTERLPDLPLSVQKSMEKMVEWIKNGVDINCFQGRGLYGEGNRDYQNMLYGIVHLHLSAKEDDVLPVVKKDGFAKPGKYLLYALFKGDNAYLVDIGIHPEPQKKGGCNAVEWTSKELLRIILNNWPGLLEDNKIEGMSLCDEKGNPIEIDDQTISLLMSNHVNTFVNINNTLYLPGMGVVGSGDSLKAVFDADRMVRRVQMAQKYFEENSDSISIMFENVLKKYGKQVPTKFDIHFDYVPVLEKFVIIDRISGVACDDQGRKTYLLSE